MGSKTRDIYSGVPLSDGRKRIKKKTPLKDKILITFFILIIISSIAALGTWFVYTTGFMGGEYEFETKKNEKYVNFLVLGLHGTLTDINLLVSLDIENQTMKFLQVPRDSYVGSLSSSSKLNAIYNTGEKKQGIQRVSDAFGSMFGLETHHFMSFKTSGFREIIDALGGVEVDVPEDRVISYAGITVPKGKQTLDGKQAEIFIRVRKAYSDSDYGRMRAQRILFEAMFRKFFTMSEADLFKAAPALMKHFNTDLSIKDIREYIKICKEIKKRNIRFFTLSGISGNYYGQSVIYINKTETVDVLNKHFRPHTEKMTLSQLNIFGDNLDQSNFVNEDGRLGDIIGEKKKAADAEKAKEVLN